MSNIGLPEIAIVLVIVLVIFGPKRLPQLGKSLGGGMREFKDAVTGRSKDDDDEEAPAIVQAKAADEPAHPKAVAAGETVREKAVSAGEAAREFKDAVAGKNEDRGDDAPAEEPAHAKAAEPS